MFQQLGIATLLGLLVGLQREHAASGIAGMRTFPLITVLGCLSAILAKQTGDGWILAAALLGVIAVTVVGHLLRPKPDPHPGTTTDVAMLLMFVVGAFLVVGPIPVAIAIGGGVAVLLQFKPELHGIARRLGDDDLRAIMQFVLITCIILPLLPSQSYGPGVLLGHWPTVGQPPGPLDVLNPREIWLMIVLIVGLSLAGYISYKFFGRNAGILLGGILGGAVSSTATTVSYARGADGDRSACRTASVVIMIASTVMYIRIVLAVTVVSPQFAALLYVPIGILMLLTLLPALVVWMMGRQDAPQSLHQTNPTQLSSALVFGLLYAGVLMAMAVARYYWNGEGLYAVSFLSGLTEMDAISLSTARMWADNHLPDQTAWHMVVVAALANLVSKTAIAGLLGGWRLMLRLTLLFTIPAAGGIAMLVLR